MWEPELNVCFAITLTAAAVVALQVCSALRKHGVTAPIDVHLMVSPVDRIVGVRATQRVARPSKECVPLSSCALLGFSPRLSRWGGETPCVPTGPRSCDRSGVDSDALAPIVRLLGLAFARAPDVVCGDLATWTAFGGMGLISRRMMVKQRRHAC